MGITNFLSKVGLPNALISASGSHGKYGKQQNAISKAGEELWKSLSSDLRSDPAAYWEASRQNAEDLTSSVCGKDIPKDLQADILANLDLLEKTLMELKLSFKDGADVTEDHIRNEFLGFRSNVVASPDHIQVLTRIKEESEPPELKD